MDSAIKLALGLTAITLLVLFVFAFTKGCAAGAECDTSGWEYFLFASPNEIGDTLAGVAGSLAFLWLITTVFLQGKELSAQRKELRLSRLAQQDQVTAFNQQRFEALFGQLFSQYAIVVQSLRHPHKAGVRGREVISSFCITLSRCLEDNEQQVAEIDVKFVRATFDSVWEDYEGDLGLYLRFLYNIFRVISESEYSEKHHHRLIRSLLTRDELVLILFNCFSSRGENFIRFVRDFEVLDNLPEGWVEMKYVSLLNSHCDEVYRTKGWK